MCLAMPDKEWCRLAGSFYLVARARPRVYAERLYPQLPHHSQGLDITVGWVGEAGAPRGGVTLAGGRS